MSTWFTPSLLHALTPYVPLFVFLVFGAFLGCFLTALAWLRGMRRPDAEKLSPYECGFNPFGELRATFHVRFYLIAILFILFDIEVIFLFPWAIAFHAIGFFGYASMILFLLILTIGFLYEWRKGALEWE